MEPSAGPCTNPLKFSEAKFDLLWYLQNGAHLLAGSYNLGIWT